MISKSPPLHHRNILSFAFDCLLPCIIIFLPYLLSYIFHAIFLGRSSFHTLFTFIQKRKQFEFITNKINDELRHKNRSNTWPEIHWNISHSTYFLGLKLKYFQFCFIRKLLTFPRHVFMLQHYVVPQSLPIHLHNIALRSVRPLGVISSTNFYIWFNFFFFWYIKSITPLYSDLDSF